jgi:D-lyxose ketol-isomerase
MSQGERAVDNATPALRPTVARRRAAEILAETGIALRQEEIERMEVADFGLGELAHSGAQILTLVNTAQIAVKLIVLLPDQTLPEHTHPPVGNYAGKEETVRCAWGEVYLYGPGDPTPEPKGHPQGASPPPAHRIAAYTVWHEYILQPGEQVMFPPGTPHWFQAGPDGAVLWSFSTKATDVQDIFTDPEIRR